MTPTWWYRSRRSCRSTRLFSTSACRARPSRWRTVSLPCPIGRAALRSRIPRDDLLIVARGHAHTGDIMQRYGDIGARLELFVDRRHGERRRAGHGARDERRRQDRRERDVSERLRTAGWIL